MNIGQNNRFRTEKDLLGTKEVLSSSYYGIHTLRALENFQISQQKIGEQHHFIRALAQVKKASAQANQFLENLPNSRVRPFRQHVKTN